MSKARVVVVMGSDSDLPLMQAALDTLGKFGVAYQAEVMSAHRSPKVVAEFAESAAGRGIRVIIAGAGGAAHLAGVVAAHTVLPVIGVPIDSSPLEGVDALYATVQMPPGVPVATVGINSSSNAALLAVQILATADDGLRARLADHKVQLAEQTAEKSKRLRGRPAQEDTE